MSRVHRLKNIQKMPISLQQAWSFFSDPHNLLLITPPFLNLKVVNKISGKEIYPGQIILYTVKPLFGIKMQWMTEITHVDKEKMFVDEQRKGPYRLWHHQLHFKPTDDGVEMTDIVHYRLPLGILGEMGHGLIVKKKLKHIFEYRHERIRELFKLGDEKPVIEMD